MNGDTYPSTRVWILRGDAAMRVIISTQIVQDNHPLGELHDVDSCASP